MAGAKFQYDENGTTFHCFVLAFMVLVVTPATCLFWPSWSSSSNTTSSSEDFEDLRDIEEEGKSEEGKSRLKKPKRGRCLCEACQRKAAHLKAKEPRQAVKQRLIKIAIILSWLALFAFAYVVYTENLEAQAATAGATFDPFAILGIDAGASKAEAKKAYHRLSLLYHPDRPETGDPRLFMRISKAYAALTDDTARRNWEEFGNPDGPGATSFGIALPAWIVAEENSLLVLLVYVAALLIGLPLVVRFWWANSSKYGGFKVLLDTTQLFFFYIHRTPAGMNPARVLKVLSGAFEFDPVSNGGEVAVRESDNWLVPRLIKALVTTSGAAPSGSALTQAENNGPNRDTPLCYPYAVKARALLYAHLYRVPLPVESSASSPNSSSSPLEADQQYLLSKCPYLLQEFVQCAAQLTGLAANGHVSHSPTLETLEAAMKLSAALVQAVPPTGKSPLLQVPHLSEHDLRFLSSRKRGRIGGLAALARLGADFGEEGEAERRAMLRRLDDRQYGDVVAFLRRLPLLTVEVKAEVLDDGEQGGRVTAGALVTTTVTLTRKDMPATVEDLEGEEGEKEGGDALKTTTTTSAKSAQEEAEKEKETAKPAKPVWNRKPAQGGGGKKNAKGRKGGGGGRQNLNQNRRRQLDFVMPKLEEISEDEADGKEEKVRSNGGDGWKIAEEKEDDSWEEKEKKGKKEENGSKKKESSSSKTSSSELFEAPSRRSHPVHCPLFPTVKQEHWWIYLTDRSGSSSAAHQQQPNHLITLPFFMTNLVESESVELKFTAPASPGTYAYTVHVRSDSYVELDYSAPLKLRVYDAPEPVTEHPQWADVSDSEEEEEEDGEDSSSGEEYSGSSDSSDGSDSDDEESNSSDSEETEEKSSTVESSSTGASNSFSKECDSGESFEL